MEATSSNKAAARARSTLTPRVIPTQARARQTVETILAAAAELLDETGIDSFNTNLLAERAGVRVRTVYRYFPNKLAVITALAERMANEWNGWFEKFEAIADPANDWRPLWDGYIDVFIDGIRATPGALAIRRAMRALPELHAIDRDDNERLARQLAAALRRRGTGAARGRLLPIARLLVETAVTVLDVAILEQGARSRTLVQELKRMHVAYLESCLD